MGRLSWFPKFILIPAGFVAVGFWGVGPRLAGNTKLRKLVQETTTHIIPGGTKPAAEPTPLATPASEPDLGATPPADPTIVAPTVTVGVQPATEDKPKPKRRRRKRTHRKPAAEAPSSEPRAPETRTGPDPGSTPDN